MTILTSVWSAQHPNAGRNIQQAYKPKLSSRKYRIPLQVFLPSKSRARSIFFYIFALTVSFSPTGRGKKNLGQFASTILSIVFKLEDINCRLYCQVVTTNKVQAEDLTLRTSKYQFYAAICSPTDLTKSQGPINDICSHMLVLDKTCK